MKAFSTISLFFVWIVFILPHTVTAENSSRSILDEIPQPDLSRSELKNLPVSPKANRVDLKKPTFSNPTNITHPLFPVNDLKQAILLGHDDGIPLQVNYSLLPEDKNKIILWDGNKIETRTVQYSAYYDRRLIEYAYDWYAQADDGSVWYFGENVYNLSNGSITDTHGTWLAGRDGPIAMIMPNNPKIGNVYRVENIPGVAFEEVEVKSTNIAVDGPYGTVTGCMIGRQLHDNASYSDKVFCPGYGEFFTEKTLDLEALALAVPTDKLSEPLSPELLTIRSGVEKIYPAVSNDDWKTIQDEINRIKTAWNTHKNSKQKISSGMATQMDRAIRNIEGDTLEPGALSQHKIGTLNGVIDIHFAILDLEMQYRSSEEIDRERIIVWSQKILIDAVAMEQGFLLSDIRSLGLLHERLRSVLPTAKANSLIIRINRLYTATRKEDFKTVTTISKQLLDIFKTR